jgi:hypothetical protein
MCPFNFRSVLGGSCIHYLWLRGYGSVISRWVARQAVCYNGAVDVDTDPAVNTGNPLILL